MARVIHFIGHVHPRLHDADNGDCGGNRVEVVWGRRGLLTTAPVPADFAPLLDLPPWLSR